MPPGAILQPCFAPIQTRELASGSHPDLSAKSRMLLALFQHSDAEITARLQRSDLGFQVAKDTGNHLVIRKPGEQRFHRLDPGPLTVSDWGKDFAELAQLVPGVLGGAFSVARKTPIPQARLVGALGGVAIEAGMQLLGAQLGEKPGFDLKQVLLSGALGAVVPDLDRLVQRAWPVLRAHLQPLLTRAADGVKVLLRDQSAGASELASFIKHEVEQIGELLRQHIRGPELAIAGAERSALPRAQSVTPRTPVPSLLGTLQMVRNQGGGSSLTQSWKTFAGEFFPGTVATALEIRELTLSGKRRVAGTLAEIAARANAPYGSEAAVARVLGGQAGTPFLLLDRIAGDVFLPADVAKEMNIVGVHIGNALSRARTRNGILYRMSADMTNALPFAQQENAQFARGLQDQIRIVERIRQAVEGPRQLNADELSQVFGVTLRTGQSRLPALQVKSGLNETFKHLQNFAVELTQNPRGILNNEVPIVVWRDGVTMTRQQIVDQIRESRIAMVPELAATEKGQLAIRSAKAVHDGAELLYRAKNEKNDEVAAQLRSDGIELLNRMLEETGYFERYRRTR